MALYCNKVVFWCLHLDKRGIYSYHTKRKGTEMMYRVKYEIDVDAESPTEAATIAAKYMKDDEYNQILEVTDIKNNSTFIELGVIPE